MGERYKHAASARGAQAESRRAPLNQIADDLLGLADRLQMASDLCRRVAATASAIDQFVKSMSGRDRNLYKSVRALERVIRSVGDVIGGSDQS